MNNIALLVVLKFLAFWWLMMFSAFLHAQSENPVADLKLKFGKGLQVVAADSSMALTLGFRFQSLFSNQRLLVDDADGESDFLIRRSRLKFDGWAVSPRLVYKVELALSNRDIQASGDFEETGDAPKIILDAVVKWKFYKQFTLWVGQTKLPGNRERVVSSQKLQFVDRSLVNSIFNIDREMGVQLRTKLALGEWVIKPMATFSFGEGRNVTIENLGGSHAVGRIELLPFGEFASKGDYFVSDLEREQQVKVAFGASYSYNNGAAKQRSAGRFLVEADGNYLQQNLETWFLDMIIKYQGLSLMTEYAHKRVVSSAFRAINSDLRTSLIDANGRSFYTGQGITTSLAYLFKNNWEVSTRYTQVVPDTAVSFSEIKEYTFGLSKYIVGHNLKVQSDMSIINNESEAAKELRFRVQMEFAF